jgi:S-(hydroxymethyl)glutathione dehydrogenase/alcohol dehydrogenase
MTRRGGRTTVVGLGPKTESVSFNALEIAHFARVLRGCMYGNADPAADIPVLLEHVRAGRLGLGPLVTRRISLDEVEPAFAEMSAGRGARSLIVFGGDGG